MQFAAFWPELAFASAAYLFGGVNTGYYLVRIYTGGDIRNLGSGSAGSANVSRVLGVRGFAVTFLGDALKGMAVTWGATWFDLKLWGVLLAMVSVVGGHIWPIQLGFRGGKGLATAFGSALIFDYQLVGLCVVASIGIYAITRERTVSGLIAVLLSPAMAALLGHTPSGIAGIGLLAALVLYAHRANISSAIKRLYFGG
jgi:glycerol-3-phosphate acyltransferase PlsY